jgi:hypothetical protein
MKFKDLSSEQKLEFIKLYYNKELRYADRLKLIFEKYSILSENTAITWIRKIKEENPKLYAINKASKDEKIEYIRVIYQDPQLKYSEKIKTINQKYDINERAILRIVQANNLYTNNWEEVIPEEFEKAKARKTNFEKKYFIITWAQNNTDLHEQFFDNLEAYANYLDAEIHVIAGRYQNPTSIFSDKEEHWNERVVPYLDAARHNVHQYLSIMSDVKIQPTADYPTTGLERLSGESSCVFGAPKVHMQSVSVMEGAKPKLVLTTGACTVENYTDSKAGKKGEFHHALGFTIVEIKDSEVFFVRQVTANDDGNFTDLIYEAKDGAVERIDKIEACVLGDLHCGQHDDALLDKTLELLNDLKPDHVVLHDVFDGYSISHHTMKDPFVQYRKELLGTNSLKDELDLMVGILNRFNHFKNVIIVRSNHDDFLDRWLKDGDWKKQPTAKNSMEYMEFSYKLLRQYATQTHVKGVIPEVINDRFPNFITLGRTSSYIIKDWEVGQHGDVGANGSRGSLAQYRKLNTKIIVGHYHTPGRVDGALAVGTSTKLRLEYNMGPSSWLQSHVIIHKDGKAQHIHFIEGEFTTFKTSK